GVIHFSISGEYITDIVRQFILEDKWETATALLLEDIHGMDYNTAVNIMTGKARLVGKDSGIDLEMIEDHEYSRNLQYHYGARYHDRLNNIWYEPYAVVTSFGDRDHSWSMKEYGTGSSKEKRAMFYADDRTSDMAVMISLDGVNHLYDTSDVIALFRRVHSAPLWMKNKNQSTEEAFISAINMDMLID